MLSNITGISKIYVHGPTGYGTEHLEANEAERKAGLLNNIRKKRN